MSASTERVEGDVVGDGIVVQSPFGDPHGAVEIVDEAGTTHVVHAAGPEGELLQRLRRGASLVITAVAIEQRDGRSHLLAHSIDRLEAERPADHDLRRVQQALVDLGSRDLEGAPVARATMSRNAPAGAVREHPPRSGLRR